MNIEIQTKLPVGPFAESRSVDRLTNVEAQKDGRIVPVEPIPKARLASIAAPPFTLIASLRCCLLFFLLGTTSILAQQTRSVTLAWNRSSNATPSDGYRLYCGTAAGVYTITKNAGTATSAAISGLLQGVTYHFAVTCYDPAGHESPRSQELVYRIPYSAQPTIAASNGAAAIDFWPSSPVQTSPQLPDRPGINSLALLPGGHLEIRLHGQPGQAYVIMTSADLIHWQEAHRGIVPSGQFNFVDEVAASCEQLFYRIETVPDLSSE
jgi:hypothetical protein